MLYLKQVILLATVVAACSGQSAASAVNIEQIGRNINDIMRQTAVWIRSLNINHPDNKNPFVNPVALFLMFGDLRRPEMACGKFGHLIITEMNSAIDKRRVPVGRGPNKNEVPLAYMREHARRCCSTYVSSFQKKLDAIGAENLEKVKTFSEAIGSYAIEQGVMQMSAAAAAAAVDGERFADIVGQSAVENVFLNKSSIGVERNRDTELKAMASALKELTGAELTNDHKALKNLFREQLQVPCEYLVSEIDEDIYRPLENDLEVARASGGKVEACNPADSEFKLALAYNKLCIKYIYHMNKNRVADELLKIVQ